MYQLQKLVAFRRRAVPLNVRSSVHFQGVRLIPLSDKYTKWSNTLKQFADELFECENFVRLALKGLIWFFEILEVSDFTNYMPLFVHR